MQPLPKTMHLPQIARSLREQWPDSQHSGRSDTFLQIVQLREHALKFGVGSDFHTGFPKQKVAFGAHAEFDRQLEKRQHVAAEFRWKTSLQRHQIRANPGL